MKELFISDLVNVPYVPQKKEWIASAIGAGAGLLTSFFGGLSASEAAKKAAAERRAEQAREDAWYTRRYNENYLDRPDVQNYLRRSREFLDKQTKKAAGAEAVAGGTAAATQMMKDSANKAYGDAVANAAAIGEQYKQRVDQQHQENQKRFSEMRVAEEQNRANAITNAAQQASNAMIAAGSAVDQMNASKVDLNGGGNNSTTLNQAVTQASINAGSKAGISNIQKNTQYDEFGRVIKMG